MNHIPVHMTRYKRYVYDLHDLIRGLGTCASGLSERHAVAWIAEHLRREHRLDLPELNMHWQGLDRRVDEELPRFTQALVRHCYQLFKPMAVEAWNASFVDANFRRHTLIITLYTI